MTIIDVLNTGTSPYFSRARHRWSRLSDAQRAEVERKFVRHLKACKKSEIDPDPSWIAEAVDDAFSDRSGEEF